MMWTRYKESRRYEIGQIEDIAGSLVSGLYDPSIGNNKGLTPQHQ